MSSMYVEELRRTLSARGQYPAEVRVALRRLSNDLEARVEHANLADRDYFDHVRKLLTQVRSASNADLRIECLFHCCNFYFLVELRRELRECAELMLASTGASTSRFWLRKVHTVLGIMFGEIGLASESILHHVKSLELARADRNFDGEMRAWTNLGATLNFGGLNRESISCTQRARDLASGIDESVLRRLNGNLALVYLGLGELDNGLRHASLAHWPLSPKMSTAHASQAAMAAWVHVALCIETGDLDAARAYVEECRQFATIGGTPLLAAKRCLL